jgi:hypothetical protein
MRKIVVLLDDEDFERLCDYAASVWDYPHEVAAWIILQYLEEKNA